MMERSGRRRGRGIFRAADERGSVLVEAAIIFPLLFFLILGAFNYGLLFRDDLTIANMTRQGPRAGGSRPPTRRLQITPSSNRWYRPLPRCSLG